MAIDKRLQKIKHASEGLLNYEITDDLFYKAFESAVQKQSYIYEKENREVVFQEWYLVKLIEEYVISDVFSQYTIDICKSVKNEKVVAN